jgi:purine-binding chemotaxis protein CheW
LHIDRVPQAEATAFASDQYSDLGSRLSCVSFQLGHTWCAIDLRYVQEVRDMPPVESSLLAHGYVIGTATLRGDIIPVVDFRSYMGNEPAFKLSAEALAKRKMLVIRTKGGLVGLMVYSIDSIVPFFERDVLPFAKLALPRGNVVSGCLVSEEKQLVMLLDHDQLLADPGLCDPARLCQEVHDVAEKVTEEKSVSVAAERRTYILFTVSSRFAMDTCSVSEVINKPEKLLKPPYALRFVEGVINLRGELITLVNLRELYGLESNDQAEEKVLIFIHKSRKYAILVDCVDEIVMTTSDKVSNDMASGLSGARGVSSSDTSALLNVSREGEDGSLVMIMCVDALVARFASESGEGAAEGQAKPASW